MAAISTSTDLGAELSALADRFFGAVVARDFDTVRSCLDPQVSIWHNFDNATQDMETNLQLLALVTSEWANFRYAQIRRHPIPGGFVQQHVLHCEGADGHPYAAPAVVIVSVSDDGHITHIDEYVDSGQLPAMS